MTLTDKNISTGGEKHRQISPYLYRNFATQSRVLNYQVLVKPEWILFALEMPRSN